MVGLDFVWSWTPFLRLQFCFAVLGPGKVFFSFVYLCLCICSLYLFFLGLEWVHEYLATRPPKHNIRLVFHEAVFKGDVYAVGTLLDHRAIKVNQRNADGCTPLFVACTCGHLEIVHLLMAHPQINPMAKNEDNSSPLHGAMAKNTNNVTITNLLIQTGLFDVNEPMKDGVTPLMVACFADLPEIVELLLSCGGNPHLQSGNKTTALFCACLGGFAEVVRVLLRVPGINVNRNNPLLAACRAGFSEIVDLLLAVPTIHVNKTDKRNRHPLQVAFKKGQHEVIRSLLSHPDIEVNTADKYQQTLLHIAVKKKDLRLIQNLVRCRHLDLNLFMNGGRTALHNAIRLPKQVKVREQIVCELLTCPGLDVNLPEEDSMLTPLHLSLLFESTTIAQAILERSDTDILRKDIVNVYPLHIAAGNGLSSFVDIFCDRAPGIINARRETDGATPLHFAAINNKGCVDVIRRLLRCPDVQVNLVTNNGWTAFNMACGCGHLSAVKAFLEIPEVDFELRSNRGASPFHEAIYGGCGEVVRFLVQDARFDVNSKTDTGLHPIHIAAARGGDAVVMKALVEVDTIDINVRAAATGCTPLKTACYYGLFNTVQELLQCPRIDPNAVDVIGRTPLHVASHKGHIEIVNALLNATDTQISPILSTAPMSPLTLAVEQGALDVVNALLSNPKMDIQYELQRTVSPLRVAALRGRVPIVQALLECEDIVKTWTTRRLTQALEQGHEGVVMELLHVPMRRLGLPKAENGEEKEHLERWDAASLDAIPDEQEREIYRNVIRIMIDNVARNVSLRVSFYGSRY